MISNKDRSGWFGASETRCIVGNYETKSFRSWWLEKLGLRINNLTNLSMMAGTNYEHKILDAVVPFARKDHQILIPELKLRVNYDGDTNDAVHEVKTYSWKRGFKLHSYYQQQVWVQQYAKRVARGMIISYGLMANDYKNFFNDIDMNRVGFHPIMYSEEFIEATYLPRLRYLCDCLERTALPKNIHLEEYLCNQN